MKQLDGVTVRPMETRDLEPAAQFFQRLSPQALFRRFFSGGDGGPRHEMTYLETLDGLDRAALVAEVDSRLVGMARFHRTEAHRAEVAVVVEDGWQRRGIGQALMTELTDAARAEGVDEFDMSILFENGPALRLLRRLAPNARSAVVGGIIEASVALAS